MPFVIRNATVGMQAIADTDTVRRHPLGLIVVADDPDYGSGEFIYLAGAASTVNGMWVTYNADDGSTTPLAPDAFGPVAVSMAACGAGQFGWYQIGGKAVGRALPGYLDNALVYATSTAGRVDDAVVAGDRVKNARGASAVNVPTSGLAEFEIWRPFVNDGTAE